MRATVEINPHLSLAQFMYVDINWNVCLIGAQNLDETLRFVGYFMSYNGT